MKVSVESNKSTPVKPKVGPLDTDVGKVLIVLSLIVSGLSVGVTVGLVANVTNKPCVGRINVNTVTSDGVGRSGKAGGVV